MKKANTNPCRFSSRPKGLAAPSQTPNPKTLREGRSGAALPRFCIRGWLLGGLLVLLSLFSTSCIRTTCLDADLTCGGAEGLFYAYLYLQSPCRICNLFFFMATTDGSSYGLYYTDGSTPTPTLVKSGFGGIDNNRSHMAFLGDRLLFTAAPSTAVGDIELWISDGTEAGTQLVKEINSNANAGSGPDIFTLMGDKMYFYADDGSTGRELWVTDGTSAGTRQVYDLLSGSSHGSPVASSLSDSMAVLNGRLYFRGSYDGTNAELYSTDGSIGIAPTKESTCALNLLPVTNIVAANGKLYMAGLSNNTTGGAPCSTGGTPSGTELMSFDPASSSNLALVSDYRTGSGDSFPAFLTRIGNRLFFQADNGTNGLELAFLDLSSPSPTVTLFADIATGAGSSSNPIYLIAYNGRLFFQADSTGAASDNEPWVSDGISAPTKLKDINSANNSFPEFYDVRSGLLFFSADDGTNGKEIWVTDGSSAGTRLLWDANPGSGSGVL